MGKIQPDVLWKNVPCQQWFTKQHSECWKKFRLWLHAGQKAQVKALLLMG